MEQLIKKPSILSQGTDKYFKVLLDYKVIGSLLVYCISVFNCQ